MRIYLTESCQISPGSDLERRRLSLFEERRPNKNKYNDINNSSDTGSIPDPKKLLSTSTNAFLNIAVQRHD